MPGKPPDERRRCTANSKRRPGERCGAWKMTGRDVCYHHGGRSPIAAGHPNFRDGARSKYRSIFSGDALEHYERGRDDPRYLELREEIAALDTLFLEELKAAKVGGGGALWRELLEAWARFRGTEPSKNATAAGRALRRVGELIGEGAARHASQREALDILERKRRLTDSERKRIVDAQQMLSQDQALAFAAAIMSAVRKNVADRETLAAISAEIALIVHQNLATQGKEQES